MSIVTKLWTYSPKSIFEATTRKIFPSKPNPAWTKVAGGPLAGAQLYVDTGIFAGWKEMAEGAFDAFIYDELDGGKIAGSVVWDIGAHFGYHSLSFAALVGDGGHVYAFEPNPFNGARFQMHLDKNPELARRITLNPIALSETNGQVMFTFSDDVDGSSSSGSHLEGAMVPLSAGSYSRFKQETVQCMTIDSLLATTSIRVPQILKIDVEGAEMMTLRGGRAFFAKHRPLVFMEVHNIVLMQAVDAFFFGLGYSIKLLDEDNSTLSRCFIVARPQ